jgi:glyoxylase-like metal-dependent hydrolase (beta-lactamase superfamily II)
MNLLRFPVLLAATSLGLAQAICAQDFSTARIVTQQVADGLHVLFGEGEGVIAGNMIASVGDQGVLLIDDQFPEIAPKYKAAIRELGGGDIDLVVNTHWHFDHADGNKLLGPEGTWIVAHETSRRMMMRDNKINLVNQVIDQPAFADDALPVFTYERSMRLHFNSQAVDLLHFGPAHTAGDTAVIFRGGNVVHLGDVFNTSGYPFIDADNGGTLSGVIDFCQAVLDRIDESATVVPGHGAVSDYAGLRDYIVMLRTIRDRMQSLIDSGATLEQIVEARPTAEWDEERGNPMMLLDRAYASMAR